MYYKHYFQCGKCKGHVVELTDSEMAIPPGRTHSEALENGGEPMIKNTVVPLCLGVLTYCAGFDKFGQKCGGNHPKGTDIFNDPPSPPPNPDWTEFANRVHAAWQLYVNSGYNIANRGPNHDRAHRTAAGVSLVLQRSGGMVSIQGGLYKSSISRTTDASLQRNAGGHAVFIYHL